MDRHSQMLLEMSTTIKVPYGYLIDSGYVGYVPDMAQFILFATEGDYLDYIQNKD